MKDAIHEQLFEELKRAGLTEIAVVTDVVAVDDEPIPRETHRAVVQQVLKHAWTAERELKELRAELVALPRLKWQAGRYEDLCVRLNLPRGDDCVSDVVAAVGRDRHQGDSYHEGRASALVEVMQLLENRLKKMADNTARSTVLWAIELIREIKP